LTAKHLPEEMTTSMAKHPSKTPQRQSIRQKNMTAPRATTDSSEKLRALKTTDEE
jgi:hypothetical protein